MSLYVIYAHFMFLLLPLQSTSSWYYGLQNNLIHFDFYFRYNVFVILQDTMKKLESGLERHWEMYPPPPAPSPKIPGWIKGRSDIGRCEVKVKTKVKVKADVPPPPNSRLEPRWERHWSMCPSLPPRPIQDRWLRFDYHSRWI